MRLRTQNSELTGPFSFGLPLFLAAMNRLRASRPTTIVWPREMQAKAAHKYHRVYRSPPRLPSEPTEKDGCHLDLQDPLSRIRNLSNRSAALSTPSPRDRVGNTSVLSVRSRALALVVALSVGHHLQTWFARMQVSNSIFN